MPVGELTDDLKLIEAEFLKSQNEPLVSEARASLKADIKAIFQPSRLTNIDSAATTAAVAVREWIGRIPEVLVKNPTPLYIDLKELTEKKVFVSVSESLQVLSIGARALLIGQDDHATFDPSDLIHVAFGADKAAVDLRQSLVDPKFKWPGKIDFSNLPDISKLIVDGTLRELISTFAICGIDARNERDWIAEVRPIGEVVAISSERVCAGQKLTISYSGFGATVDPLKVADVMVALPTIDGCVHISLSTLGRKSDIIERWSDSGKIAVVLPQDIFTGCIGFFSVPPPLSNGGACTPGGLVAAAGMLQSVLGDYYGRAGVIMSQNLVELANTVEAGRHGEMPCAVCQPNNANHINAGPPIIYGFHVVETGPLYPRGTFTIEWSVSNADEIEVFAEDVTESENAHELPQITDVADHNSRVRATVNCTRRWEGRYVLQARNANKCGTGPVEARVTLYSGFSEYLVGASRVDITDARPNQGMAGFAFEGQTTSGDVAQPQFARAFVIKTNVKNPSKIERLALVVADIWICSQSVKRGVLEELRKRGPAFEYNDSNLLIAATHTHSGPGGYSDYMLYNLTIGGLNDQLYQQIVNGIVSAICNASASCYPGRIYLNNGDLADCGANRSFEAFKKNAEFKAGIGRDKWTDRDMVLLRFDQDIDSRGKRRPIGALNWFALHPTSLGMRNRAISGDNKGWAESLCETTMGGTFVAAFGNAAAGDVSGNVVQTANGDAVVFKPLGGPEDTQSKLLLVADTARMKALGQMQADHAMALFSNATTELTGGFSCAHQFVDMSKVNISGQAGAKTWPAALGVSFGAGSSEDSDSLVRLLSIDFDMKMREGTDIPAMVLGGIESWAVIATLAPAIRAAVIASITTGTPIATALILPTFKALAVIILLDHARTYLAATLGAAFFQGKLNEFVPEINGVAAMKWIVPPMPSDYAAGHGAKPIMFPVGLAKIKKVLEDDGTPIPEHKQVAIDCPVVPQVQPLQLIKFGPLVIAAVPAEFTTMAGMRLKAQLRRRFGPSVSHAAISGYSNGYSGYVTTPEEYDLQHYEGASTLFGPHTLAAYLQVFDGLANLVSSGVSNDVGRRAKVAYVHKIA